MAITEQTKISVIIPVHNGKDCLTACVESVMAQNIPNLEIIIINDGSTDCTGEVCQELQERYGIIQVIAMEDLGVSAARNAGLYQAAGEYVTFVDADDRLLPGMLVYLLETAGRTGSDIVGCGFVPWYGEEEWERLASRDCAEPLGSKRCEEITYTGVEFIDKGILNQDTRCWSKLYLRKSVENIYFREDITIGEDMLFLLEAVMIIDKITITDYKGYGYFQNPTGAMNRSFKDSYMDQITCWQIAGKLIAGIRPDLRYKAAGIQMISIMLTAGKIAELPGSLHKQYYAKLDICRKCLLEAGKIPGAYAYLTKGYKVKVQIFRRFPLIYVKAYYWRKRIRN